MVEAVEWLRDNGKNYVGIDSVFFGSLPAQKKTGRELLPCPFVPTHHDRRCGRLLRLVQMRQCRFGMLRSDIGVARLAMLDGFSQMLDPLGKMWVFSSSLGMVP